MASHSIVCRRIIGIAVTLLLITGCKTPQVFDPKPFADSDLETRRQKYEERKLVNDSFLTWRRYSTNGNGYSPASFENVFEGSSFISGETKDLYTSYYYKELIGFYTGAAGGAMIAIGLIQGVLADVWQTDAPARDTLLVTGAGVMVLGLVTMIWSWSDFGKAAESYNRELARTLKLSARDTGSFSLQPLPVPREDYYGLGLGSLRF